MAVDQLTKAVSLRYLVAGESVPVIPNVFHLTLVSNTGIAFGFFKDHGTLLLLLISCSLLLLFWWGMKHGQSSLTARVGLGLILGGAFGNWIDRVRVGGVIDFLDFRIWPVFNVADTAISIGVGLYLLLLFFPHKNSETVSAP